MAREKGQARPSETEAAGTEAALGERMNANTVSVITGTPGGTYFRIGADLAFVLDDGDKLRILPILGKGAGENAYDIRFLKGVDLGFVRTDTLDQLRQDKRLKDIDQRIQYIAKLFNDELHVIAPNAIKDVRELAGKRVTFDVKGSGTDYSGRAMFRGLGVTVEPSTSTSRPPSRCCARARSRRWSRWRRSPYPSWRASIRVTVSTS